MPTPPVADATIERTVAERPKHDSNVAAAEALGISEKTVRRHLALAAERGMLSLDPVMPGFAIKSVASKTAGGHWVKQTKAAGEEYETPPNMVIGKRSVLTDSAGRVMLTWNKEDKAASNALDTIETLKHAFDDVVPAKPKPSPTAAAADLLTLVPCNDWHLNLLAWEREVGENWDLRIAEEKIGGSIEDAIDRSPKSAVGVVLGGGDLVHADNNENRTAKSGNVLDADGRHQKALETACRLKVRTIDAALRRNDDVIVRILPGNHDEYTSVAVAYFLLAYYRNEPRVTVDVDASLFWWYVWGRVMLGATHGHTVKAGDMAQIMAHRRAEEWGSTKFRYVHVFHVHHKSKYVTEGGGVITETHQAPVPQDFWHYGAGFLSGRSVQTISYHKDYGEVSRARVAILDAANDNAMTAIAA